MSEPSQTESAAAPGAGATEDVVRAGILITGTEVLTATISDRNGPWLSEQLTGLGIELVEIIVVADHPADLLSGLEHMHGLGLDLIITSGGLGPTADDLTAEVVASFAGRELEAGRGDGSEDRGHSGPLRGQYES